MKNKGFVMIETIVVITILSIGLISLYASYSLILSRVSTKSNYDNVAYVYKTYFVHKYLAANSMHLNEAVYEVDTVTDAGLKNIMETFKMQRIHIYTSSMKYDTLSSRAQLVTFDGTTIGYIRNMTDYNDDKRHIIVKFVEPSIAFPEFKVTNFASLEYEI